MTETKWTPKIAAPVRDAPEANISNIKLSEPPSYKKGDSLATRQAYGNALVKIAKNNDRVIGLDGDMKNSTFSQNLRKEFPDVVFFGQSSRIAKASETEIVVTV